MTNENTQRNLQIKNSGTPGTVSTLELHDSPGLVPKLEVISCSTRWHVIGPEYHSREVFIHRVDGDKYTCLFHSLETLHYSSHHPRSQISPSPSIITQRLLYTSPGARLPQYLLTSPTVEDIPPSMRFLPRQRIAESSQNWCMTSPSTPDIIP